MSNRPPFEQLRVAVRADRFWEPYITACCSDEALPFSVHLAVCVEPYLTYMLQGEKTVESRFSAVRCPPYQRVKEGDVILLKRAGGPVLGICRVRQTWFFALDPDSWKCIRRDFTQSLCARDPTFWRCRENASYATLMRIDNILSIAPVRWAKRDRRGWVVVKSVAKTSMFESA